MSVWRLPRYLVGCYKTIYNFKIVHFKRFEYLHSERRMGKCKRVIDFPLDNFDTSQFINKSKGEKYDCIAIAVGFFF